MTCLIFFDYILGTLEAIENESLIAKNVRKSINS